MIKNWIKNIYDRLFNFFTSSQDRFLYTDKNYNIPSNIDRISFLKHGF